MTTTHGRRAARKVNSVTGEVYQCRSSYTLHAMVTSTGEIHGMLGRLDTTSHKYTWTRLPAVIAYPKDVDSPGSLMRLVADLVLLDEECNGQYI